MEEGEGFGEFGDAAGEEDGAVGGEGAPEFHQEFQDGGRHSEAEPVGAHTHGQRGGAEGKKVGQQVGGADFERAAGEPQ